MRLETTSCRARFAEGRVGHLGTVRDDGAPHVVPVTFALAAPDVIVFAVDHKPKQTTDLVRVRNLRRDPRVTVLVDEYADDWVRLWWVRADGRARVVTDPATRSGAVRALADKYEPYRAHAPAGPVVSVAVARWTGWSASPPSPADR
jgi:PPOX class probable F420-dependent enzyme